MEVWILLAWILVIIFFLFSVTFYLYWYSRNYDCQYTVNPWCWNDWTCSNGSKPAQSFYGCGPNDPEKTADYCQNYTGTPPPGCNCIPVNGVVPPTCQFSWSAANLGQCANLLANTKNNNFPKISGGCQTSS